MHAALQNSEMSIKDNLQKVQLKQKTYTTVKLFTFYMLGQHN